VAHGQRVLQVEHGLLPVRVPRPGPGAEADGLVAAPELDVEVADERVDEVVAAGGQLEGRLQADMMVISGGVLWQYMTQWSCKHCLTARHPAFLPTS